MVPSSAIRTAVRRGVALALWLGIALPAAALPQGPPTPVRVDTVRAELLQNRRQVTGDLRAVHRSEVAAREKGLVVELAVREGQLVEAGAVLAKLDAERLELALAVLEAQRGPARAMLRERESDLVQKSNDLESLEELLGRQAANPKELADAKTARTAAEARLKQSEGELLVLEARIVELRLRVRDMTVVAPFAGTIISRLTEVGAWLNEGSPVCELLSTGELEVWLEVPQALLGSTRQGMSGVEVRIDATGERLELASYRTVPDVNPRARTFRLVAAIEASPSRAAGMSVTAMVPLEERQERLTLSRDAILRNEVGTFVYFVMPGAEGAPSRAVPLMVEVLFHTAERVVVDAPRLMPGGQVVVEGNERLFPMAPIQPIPVGGPPDTPEDALVEEPGEQPDDAPPAEGSSE